MDLNDLMRSLTMPQAQGQKDSTIIELEPIEANKLRQSHTKVVEISPRESQQTPPTPKKQTAAIEKKEPQEDEGLDFEQIFRGRGDSQSKQRMSFSEVSTRAPPDPNNPFHKLPDELMYKILSRLDEEDLGRAARVSRKWHRLACDAPLWRFVSQRWTLLPPEALIPSDPQSPPSRQFYVEKYQRFQYLQAEALARQRQEAMQQLIRERQRRRLARVRRAEDVLRVTLFNRVADYVSYFGLLLGTIFTVLRLDQQILWPWKLVLIPFAFPLFHALFSLLSYDLTRLCLGPEVHPNLNGTLGEHTGQSHALAHVFSLMRAFRIETYIVTTSIVASAVMIWYKISTQSLTLPWWAAVFPLALALFTLLLTTIFGNSLTRTRGQFAYPPIWETLHYSDRGCMSYYATLGVLLVVFIALMLMRHVTWSWWTALSPVWAAAVGCLLTPVFYMCLSCISRTSTVVLADISTSFICWVSSWLFFVGPFVAFIILIASNLTKWHLRSWAAVFAPLFVLEAILFCVCIAYDVVILSDD